MHRFLLSAIVASGSLLAPLHGEDSEAASLLEKRSGHLGLPGIDPAREAVAWRLWDDQAAPRWDLGYPVGNGQLGAISCGTFPRSVISLSHDAVWKSGSRPAVAANSRVADMNRAWELCLKGDYKAAQQAYGKAKNKGGRISTFQGLGDLVIEHLGGEVAGKVTRQLDLDRGEATAMLETEAGQIWWSASSTSAGTC